MKLRHNAKIDLIKGVPLFAAVSKKELAEIAALADEIDLPDGKVLIREGDDGREFFVLIEGTAEVRRNGRKLATLGPGDFFGEVALICKSPRNATITATAPVRALVITDRAFRQLLDDSPKISARVMSGLGERLAPTTL